MNYKKLYDTIISNTKDKTGYTELHHIVPSSLGGSDDSSNLVELTTREHFICHYLLTKIYPKESFEWYKMNHAFMMMKCDSVFQDRYFNSRLYESLRKDFSKVMSKSQSGENNSQYGTYWIHHPLIGNKKIKKSLLPEYIDQGWIKGQDKFYIRQIKRNIKIQSQYEKKRKYYTNIFIKYLKSDYRSLNMFCKSEYDKSLAGLTKNFIKYVDGYKEISSQGTHKIKDVFKKKYGIVT